MYWFDVITGWISHSQLQSFADRRQRNEDVPELVFARSLFEWLYHSRSIPIYNAFLFSADTAVPFLIREENDEGHAK